jgi:hypothetical protein
VQARRGTKQKGLLSIVTNTTRVGKWPVKSRVPA